MSDNNKAPKMYRRHKHNFVLGSGYVATVPVIMTAEEVQAELERQGGQCYQNVWFEPIEHDEKLDAPLTIGYYQPTPAFNIIREHVCVMRVTDQVPVALIGSSADDEGLPDTMHYARLFASAPAILDQNQRANDLIERIDAMIEEAMQEWYAIALAFQPLHMLELAQMRDAIQEYNSYGKDGSDDKGNAV